MGFVPAFLKIVICCWPRKGGRNGFTLQQENFLLDSSCFWLYVWWSTVKKQIALRQCGISPTGGTEEHIAPARKRAGELGPASSLALPLVVPAQAPAGSCCGWEDGAENHHGDTGTPSSTFKGAYVRKVRFCMTFYWSSGFVKATVPVLQACSPTTRTRTAIGSAALSVITILNSDWLELYPFMSTRQC